MENAVKITFRDKIPPYVIASIVFIIALSLRLVFIFTIAEPNYASLGAYDDGYDRWKIAYLSKEVGFHTGFLQLYDNSWDPYFWGLMHPLLASFSFSLAGKTDIAVMRVMTAILGSISVLLLFLLCKKYWNIKVALFAALFAALSPVGIYNDSSGVSEPIGTLFILSAAYFWDNRPFLTGLNLAMALMTRAEYWFISVLAAGFFNLKSETKLKEKLYLLGGFLPLTGLYLVYLYKYTGNPIYPVYKNFIVNILQGGLTKASLVAPDMISRMIFLAVFVIAVLLLIFTLTKKPKGFSLLLIGSLNLLYLGTVFGISNYYESVTPVIWHHRYVAFLYLFAGTCVSILLFSTGNRSGYKYRLPEIPNAVLIFVVCLVIIQMQWLSIIKDYSKNKPVWDNSVTFSKSISAHYPGGNIVIVEDILPYNFYNLYKYANIPGENIISDKSDPFFKMKEDAYDNWDSYKSNFISWTKDNNIRTIITYKRYSARYEKIADDLPLYMVRSGNIPGNDLMIYKIRE